MEISLNPKRFVAVMLAIITVLAVMHITQLIIYFQTGDPEIFDFIELLDFDYETNLPSYYSSTAIFICAIWLWIISAYERQLQSPFRWHWTVLAAIFTFLSIDEAIAIHENIGDFVEELQLVDATGYLYFAWVVPYGILMLLFAISYLKFVLSLPKQIMILFVVSGVVFLSGAMGFEIVSAREADLHGTETILYSTLYTLEELCEMLGIALFCYGLMRYIEQRTGDVRLKISS